MNSLDQSVEIVRRFNRFYTKQIGVLHEGLLASPFTLTQARVVYELAHHGETSASELCGELNLDPGYMSRILRGFKSHGLIEKKRSEHDGRQTLLRLSEQGQQAFANIDSASRIEIGRMLSRLSPQDRDRLLKAMESIEEIYGMNSWRKAPYLLRGHQPGDMGWVVQRHGALYAQEYGLDLGFEALVAGIVAAFISNFDPSWERCWIAEMDGEIVGSVFLVKSTESVAKLRLLIVEPKARGVGLGGRLVQECIHFARGAGYEKLTLWTNSVLVAARHLYQKAGMKLVHAESHHSFGQDLVGETWELQL